MSNGGVQFEEDNFSFSSASKSAKSQNNQSVGYGHPQYENTAIPKGMSGWLIKHGLASSGGTAQVILIGIVIINIIITYAVVTYFL